MTKFVLTALLLITVGLGNAEAIANTVSPVSQRIDSYIEKTMRQHQIPGAAVAVVRNGGVRLRRYSKRVK